MRPGSVSLVVSSYWKAAMRSSQICVLNKSRTLRLSITGQVIQSIDHHGGTVLSSLQVADVWFVSATQNYMLSYTALMRPRVENCIQIITSRGLLAMSVNC